MWPFFLLPFSSRKRRSLLLIFKKLFCNYLEACMIAPFSCTDKSKRFNHKDIKTAIFFWCQINRPHYFYSHYWWSPWLQEAPCTLSPPLTLSARAVSFPSLPFLPLLLPLTAGPFLPLLHITTSICL